MEQDRAVELFANVSGRSIVNAIHAVVHLWNLHRATLSGPLGTSVTSALDTLAAAWTAIMTVNPPGPE